MFIDYNCLTELGFILKTYTTKNGNKKSGIFWLIHCDSGKKKATINIYKHTIKYKNKCSKRDKNIIKMAINCG